MAPAEFDSFYRREYGRVLALAYVLSGSREAAEDLAQDSFLAAHRQWERIERYDEPGAWVRRICLNRSTSLVRRRIAEAKAIGRVAARRVLPDELPPDAEAFWQAVRRLPRRQAQVVGLHYVDDRSIQEIATLLECAEGTVKAHLHRARKALGADLGLHVSDEGGGQG